MLCATIHYVGQLFSLGHVSGPTKILQLARRGVSSGWFPEEKRAKFAVKHVRV
jgi:hypothetical protein